MPNVRSEVHPADPLMTNFAIEYHNPEYVYNFLFPKVAPNPVKDTGRYAVFGREVFGHGNRNLRWKPGDDFNIIRRTITSNTFTCLQYSADDTIDDEELRNADSIFDLRRDKALFVADALDLERERIAATKALTAGNYPNALTTTLTTTARWSDTSGTSNPIEDLRAAANAVRSQIGRLPNRALFSWKAWSYFIVHPDIVEIHKYTNPMLVSPQMVSSFLSEMGIREVVVGKAVRNTADEGATESLADVWEEDVVLAYVEPTPSRRTATYGTMFTSLEASVKYIDMPEDYQVVHDTANWTFEFPIQDSNGDSLAGYLIKDAGDDA